METVKRFNILVEKGVYAPIEITVDFDKLAIRYGRKAHASTGKKAVLAFGAVVIKVRKD